MHSISEIEKNKIYDAVIIGGGINGAGIALDAALRGLSVIIVEKNDFASSTTSASTKLIHGGLRYLEYYEFPLVRESLGEREKLLKNAPHLVSPLKLTIPIYKNNKRGIFLIKMGMILYDILSFDKSLPNHTLKVNFKGKKFKNIEPSLNQKDLKAIASYYDCQVTFPERLCLELILSAKEAGADVFNHTEFMKLEIRKNINHLLFYDSIIGKETQVKAKVVINAAGPYVDIVNNIVSKKIPRMMGGTKGSHIIIDKFSNGPKEALYVEAKQDRRPFFILPWRDYYLVGTTDKFFDGNLDNVSASKDEVEYLVKELNHFITTKHFTLEDVLYTYSGIRPLPYEPGKKEKQITRKHIVYDHEKFDGQKNYISIIGGKLTTYRRLAQDAVDMICTKLNIQEHTRTKNFLLIGAAEIKKINDYKKLNAEKYASKYSMPVKQIEFLINLYGSRFKNVLALINNDQSMKERICNSEKDIKAQVVFAALREEAKTLDDIMRRIGAGTSEKLGLECAEAVARIAAFYLNWSENEIVEQVDVYSQKVKNFFKLEFSNEKLEENAAIVK